MKKIFLVVLLTFSLKFTEAQILDSLVLDSVFAYTSIAEAMINPDKVIKLELDKKHLKVFPMEIFKMKNLQYLDVSKNGLKEIPDSLNYLLNLQYFNASNNKIETIPNSITKLQNLRWLIINRNEISSVAFGIGTLEKLEYLDMWSNNLSYFSESLRQLKNIKTVDLRNILLNEEMQNKIHDLMPSATIYMDKACNCK
jgi:Leucine-rich repeat (LRR) protein